MSCKCQMCGKYYIVDFLVSDDLWKKISPKKNDSGLLCGKCIITKIEELNKNEYSYYCIENLLYKGYV